MSIRLKLLITFMAIAIIPMLLVSALSFYGAQKSLREASLNDLRALAAAKKIAVLEYLSGKKGRAIDFASDGFIRDQAELITKSADTREKILASRLLNSHLKINKKPLDEEIVEIRALDLKGGIIATSEGEFLLGLDMGKGQPYFMEGQNKTYIQDAGIFRHYDLEEEVISIGTPIKTRGTNKTIGVLVNFYSLNNIKDVLLGIKNHQWQEAASLDEEKSSRDIFLLNQDGMLLTPSKKISDYSPLKQKIETEPLAAALDKWQTLNKSWTDAKGNTVFGASAILEIEKGWRWILVIEQNRDEVFTSIYALRNFSIMTALFTLLLVIITAILTARSIAQPISRITEVTEKISKGESEAKVDLPCGGEIGKLTESFNRMIENEREIENKLRSANAKIGEEKTKYEMVLASIGDGMITVDGEGKIVLLNSAAEKMFGWKKEEISEKSLSEVIPAEDEKGNIIPFNERTMAAALARGVTTHESSYYYRKDNTKFPAALTASPIKVDGKIIGAIGLFRDVTKEKEVDRMKTDFISTVSHEIRTPLTTIREGVSQALDGILGETTQKQREVFSIVLEDSDRLKRIIDNLLDISKIEAGMVELKKEFVDLAAAVKCVVAGFSLIAKEKSLSMETSFSPEKIKAFADKDRIIQVFTNLIGNSLKFTQSGRISIALSEKDAFIECSVSDTGGGIAKEDLPRVFSKFQQFGRTAGPGEKGTGLGLSITKAIIELHKGKIWIDSELDKGTKVTFSLPKYSTRELFRECVTHSLKKISKEDAALSILIFNLKDISRLKEKMDQEKISSLVYDLQMLVKSKIRRETDIVVENDRLIMMILSGMKKEGALIVLGRIQDSFDNYLAKEPLGKEINIIYETFNYPQDAKTADEMISKISSLKNID